MACACCQQILFEPRSSADAGSAADAGSNSYSFSLALTSLPIAAVSHTHTTKREWPMRSDDSLTHTAAGRRKRIGRTALVSTEQRQQPPRWPGNCLCVRVSKGGVANGNALAAATRLTHTHTRRQTGKLSDAMLQLTIFPNAINNRWLSLALLLPKNTKAAKKRGLGQKKRKQSLETLCFGREPSRAAGRQFSSFCFCFCHSLAPKEDINNVYVFFRTARRFFEVKVRQCHSHSFPSVRIRIRGEASRPATAAQRSPFFGKSLRK